MLGVKGKHNVPKMAKKHVHASNVSKTSMRTSLQAAHARQQNKMKILMASVGKRNVKILALFVSMVLFSTGGLDKGDIHEKKIACCGVLSFGSYGSVVIAG